MSLDTFDARSVFHARFKDARRRMGCGERARVVKVTRLEDLRRAKREAIDRAIEEAKAIPLPTWKIAPKPSRQAQEGELVKVLQCAEIQRAVCAHFKLPLMAMVTQQRTHDVVLPRQIAMYLCKHLTDRGFPFIGKRFGGRDHTTVGHAIKKIERLKSSFPVKDDIELICEALGVEAP